MKHKNNIPQIEKILKNKKQKLVALVAPSFVTNFKYPDIIHQLKKLGFDKVVELTFGAKMINREYHEILKTSKTFKISSVCPGIVQTIKNSPEFRKYEENLIKVDSPMTAMAKICRKTFPKHKTCFLSPCHFKKIEAENSKFVDYVIDYNQLEELFRKNNLNDLKFNGKIASFDRFYNDYTKIYPLGGGLSKTAHLKDVIKRRETKIKDGWARVEKILKKEKKLRKLKFLDVNFCRGGCIGGPCTNQNISIRKKRKLVLRYLSQARCEDIPEVKKGLVEKARGISFRR